MNRTAPMAESSSVVHAPERPTAQLVDIYLTDTASTGAEEEPSASTSSTFAAPPRSGKFHTALSALGLATYLATRPISGQGPTRFRPEWAWTEISDDVTAAIGALRVDDARRELLGILQRVHPENLEDGMTLSLGIGLAACLESYGDACVTDLATLVSSKQPAEEVLSHALRWIGRLKDVTTGRSRTALLIRSLESQSSTIRDGAALGLVELAAPESTLALRAALAREPDPWLRQDLEQAVAYLAGRVRDSVVPL
jgi:hypothetical protein